MIDPEQPRIERHSRLQVNTAYFSVLFTTNQVGAYIVDKMYNPEVMDVPRGAVIALGLGAAALGTAFIDHRRPSPEI